MHVSFILMCTLMYAACWKDLYFFSLLIKPLEIIIERLDKLISNKLYSLF